jgi:hypothetical protein
MEIKTFLSLNCPECNEGQFRDQKSRDLHEKSRDLSNYEIFQHKILKSQSFSKKSSILVILCHAEHLFLHSGQFRDKKVLISMKISLIYIIFKLGLSL